MNDDGYRGRWSSLDEDEEPRPPWRGSRRLGVTTIWQWWHAYVDPALWEHKDVSTAPPLPVFAKGVKKLREKWDDWDILRAIRRFATMIDQGDLNLAGKNAWFVFLGMRHKLYVPQTEEVLLTEVPDQEEVEWWK